MDKVSLPRRVLLEVVRFPLSQLSIHGHSLPVSGSLRGKLFAKESIVPRRQGVWLGVALTELPEGTRLPFWNWSPLLRWDRGKQGERFWKAGVKGQLGYKPGQVLQLIHTHFRRGILVVSEAAGSWRAHCRGEGCTFLPVPGRGEAGVLPTSQVPWRESELVTWKGLGNTLKVACVLHAKGCVKWQVKL